METVVLVLGATAVLVLAWGAIRVRQRRPPAGKQYGYCRCPACGQKVRFPAKNAGKVARCPRCLGYCPLPAVTDPREAARAVQQQRTAVLRVGRMTIHPQRPVRPRTT
jgi:hypothetical protein